MGDKANFKGKVSWYKQSFILIGIFLSFFSLIASVTSLFTNSGIFLNVILVFQTVLGVGIFLYSYGLALIQGRRWHLFGLLIFVFFGSFLSGLFSMIGRESTIGYYIWAIGGVCSLSLIVILVKYWEKLLDS